MGHITKPRKIMADMTAEISTEKLMWELLVPTRGNDGTPFTRRHHRHFDNYIKDISGGLTLVSPVRGDWVDPSSNVEYTERMIPVRALCTRHEIVEIAKEAARWYDQIAVLATLVSVETVVVTNPHATG